jgi:hypothetical protein
LENALYPKEQSTLRLFEHNITLLDDKHDDTERKTFDGGCVFLINWYRSNYY